MSRLYTSGLAVLDLAVTNKGGTRLDGELAGSNVTSQHSGGTQRDDVHSVDVSLHAALDLDAVAVDVAFHHTGLADDDFGLAVDVAFDGTVDAAVAGGLNVQRELKLAAK